MVGLQQLSQVGDGVELLEGVCLDPLLVLLGRPQDLPVLVHGLGPVLLDDGQTCEAIEGRNIKSVGLLGLSLGLVDQLLQQLLHGHGGLLQGHELTSHSLEITKCDWSSAINT